MGRAFLDAVGASAGPLYCDGFAVDAVTDRLNLDGNSVAVWLSGLCDGIMTRGNAEVGDKTMVDAWEPAFKAALTSARGGASAVTTMDAAAKGAEQGADATIQMQSNRGRSKKLGARSVGHKDPGAASAAIMVAAWAKSLAQQCPNAD